MDAVFVAKRGVSSPTTSAPVFFARVVVRIKWVHGSMTSSTTTPIVERCQNKLPNARITSKECLAQEARRACALAGKRRGKSRRFATTIQMAGKGRETFLFYTEIEMNKTVDDVCTPMTKLYKSKLQN